MPSGPVPIPVPKTRRVQQTSDHGHSSPKRGGVCHFVDTSLMFYRHSDRGAQNVSIGGSSGSYRSLGGAGNRPGVSPYLTLPVRPLAVALQRILENTQAELANEKLACSEKRRLRQRTELVCSLLALRVIT